MKKTLSLIILSLFICTAANAATVGYWQFDDNEPGTVTVAGQRVVDSSGNGRDLYTVGDTVSLPTYKPSNPLYGDGAAIGLTSGADELHFEPGHVFGDGGSNAGTSIDFAAADSFTIEAMVRIPASTSTSAICTILQKYPSAGTYPSIYFRFENSTSIRFSLADTDNVVKTYTVTGLANCYDGNWHHVAAVRDYLNAEMIIYLDGVEVGSVTEPIFTGSFTDTAAKWYFGSMGPDTSTTREFIGSIDFIRISNAALLPADFIQPSNRLASIPSPADKAYNITIPSVTLGWTPASGSGITLSSQTVQVATDSDFANIVQTFNLNGTASSANLTPVVNGRRYFWRVNSTGTDNGSSFNQTGLPWYFQTVDANTTVAGYWKFNNGTPGTAIDANSKIIDSSGNGRNLLSVQVAAIAGTIFDNPCASYGSGASFSNDKGMMLNLMPGYVYADSSIAGSVPVLPSSNGDVTIEAVVKAVNGGTGKTSTIFSVMPLSDTDFWYGVDKTDQFYFRVNDTGYLRFTFANAGTVITATGVTSLHDDTWHHVAAVRNTAAGKLLLYIDGVLNKDVNDTTTALGDMFPDGYASVGGFSNYPTSTVRNFNGNIDFVKVTHAALSPAQFVQAFALPTNPNPVSGATGVPINYTFSWTPIAGATITSQTVKIATDQYMQNIIKTVVASGNSAAITGLENNTAYYWRVDTVGSDGGGAFNRQGTIWSFNTPSCTVTVEMGNLFDEDCIIDFKDFAIMANNWLLSEFE